MRWQGREGSRNIEDRRGMRAGVVGGGLGIGGLLLLFLFSALTGQDPGALLGTLPQGPSVEVGPTGSIDEDDPQAQLISVVLRDTEDTWSRLFSERGATYPPPTLVLFTGATQSACGVGQSAMGPFYCPADRKVYLDLSFFRELDQQFGAPGDFAQAYVVAHEVGHHIQTITGLSQQVQQARQRAGEREGNALSVRQELQADCFAGVWGHHAGGQTALLEPGDVEDGLRAAAAIGDDRLQRRAQGYVVPESFTHGSSEQRVEWLRRGLQSGRLEDCDTFASR